MSKKSKMNKRDNRNEQEYDRDYFSTINLDREALIDEGVKESRIDNSYSRKQAGKNRDKARREQAGNKRKINRR